MKNTSNLSVLFKRKYRIPSTRLQNWDYGRNASYFITICTKNRNCYFGEIRDCDMYLSDMGKLADQFWIEIPEHFPFIELGKYVVMPNHVHGILIINKGEFVGDNVDNVETRHALSLQKINQNNVQKISNIIPQSISNTPNPVCKTKGQERFQNQGKNTISSIVGSYKSAVTNKARIIFPDFEWQSRFHDHIIRNEDSFRRISEYIINNPANWREDKFYKQ